MNDTHNGWNEWSKYVLKELERLNEGQKEGNEKIDDLNDKINTFNITMSNHIVEQKTKAITYGGVAGGVVSVTLIVIAGLSLLFNIFGGG